MRDISCDVLPIRDHAFFKQAIFQRRLGQCLLQLARLGPKRLHLVGGCFAGRHYLMPIDGFFEWKAVKGQRIDAGVARQPHAHVADLDASDQAKNDDPSILEPVELAVGA